METEFHLIEFCFCSFPLRKFLKIPFPFVSVKTSFESSVKIPFLLMALSFHVNPLKGLSLFRNLNLSQNRKSVDLRA